jgi:hypothetical protein
MPSAMRRGPAGTQGEFMSVCRSLAKHLSCIFFNDAFGKEKSSLISCAGDRQFLSFGVNVYKNYGHPGNQFEIVARHPS